LPNFGELEGDSPINDVQSQAKTPFFISKGHFYPRNAGF